jgi:hypothetical protein
LIEIESFTDSASAEVFAATLRAAGVQPELSRAGPLAGLGGPTHLVVLVPTSQVDLARQILGRGKAVTEKLERDARVEWLKVPPADLEAGLRVIRQKLRVMWWSSAALPASILLAMAPGYTGWLWLSAVFVSIGIGTMIWAARAVDRCRCPRCNEHFFHPHVRGAAKYLLESCIRCGLRLRGGVQLNTDSLANRKRHEL